MQRNDEYMYDILSTPRTLGVATLLPGYREDDLQIKLEVQHLDFNPQYEAVSYCWGEAERKHSIICEGSAIMVTSNLIAALRRFRYAKRSRTLWIDTICINQSDLTERKHQVNLMGEIHSSAKHVLIWLGEGNENTELAYACVNALCFDLGSSKSSIGPVDIWALLALLHRPWFCRAWIFQESVLACNSDIVTGSYHVSKNVMWRLCHITVLKFQSPWQTSHDENIHLQNLHDMLQRLRCLFQPVASFNPNTIEAESDILPTLLAQRRGVKAFDPRDIVYSLIGVVKRFRGISHDSIFNDSIPEADYNTLWQDVYAHTTKALIWHTSCFEILREAGIKTENCPLPSWVPDWRKTIAESGTSLEGKYASIQRKVFGAPRAVDWSWWNSSSNKLHLRGVCIGRVHSVVSFSNCQELKSFLADTTWHRFTSDLSTGILMQLIYPKLSLSPFYPGMSLFQLESDIQQMTLDGVRIFRTEEGYLGIARAIIREGDKVYKFLALNYTMLIRETICMPSTSLEEYILVGECRIHGTMPRWPTKMIALV